MGQQVKSTTIKAKPPSLGLTWPVSLTSEQAWWHTGTHTQQELRTTDTVTVRFFFFSKKLLGSKVE